MRLSWACILPLLPFPVTAELAAGLGFSGIDLIVLGDETSIRLDDVRRDPSGWAAKVDEQVRGRGLEIADVFAISSPTDNITMAPNHPDAREVEAGRALFREMVEFVAQLGAPGLTMVPGVDWEAIPHEESLSRAAKELGQRAAEAHERGIRFSVEPHRGSVCATPFDAVRLCEMAPGLELTVDYSHYISQGLEESEIESMLDYARHVHARNARTGQLQCTNRECAIDWERMIDRLRANAYDGWVSIEHVWAEHTPGLNGVDALSEGILLRDRLQAKLAIEHSGGSSA